MVTPREAGLGGKWEVQKGIELQFPFPPAQSNSITYEQRWKTAPPWRAVLGSVHHGCVLLVLGYEEVSPE